MTIDSSKAGYGKRLDVEQQVLSLRSSIRIPAPDVTELKTKFLSRVTDGDREAILSAAAMRSLPARAIVTNQDDLAQYVFVLTSGAARHYFTTIDGRKQLLLWLTPGDIFGAATLLQRRCTYLVSTEILSESTVAVWSRPVIRALVEKYPILLDNALTVASDYLTWYVSSHSALCYRSARERLVHVLTTLAHGIGRAGPDGVELQINNEELANAANVTPFTVSRLLSRWQRTGAIIKNRGRLLLRDPKSLLER